MLPVSARSDRDAAAEGAAASGQPSEELTARAEFTTCSSEQKPKINTPLIRLCSVLLWRDRHAAEPALKGTSANELPRLRSFRSRS
jgi:hypothetical protein